MRPGRRKVQKTAKVAPDIARAEEAALVGDDVSNRPTIVLWDDRKSRLVSSPWANACTHSYSAVPSLSRSFSRPAQTIAL
jgi:hypothetical protein